MSVGGTLLGCVRPRRLPGNRTCVRWCCEHSARGPLRHDRLALSAHSAERHHALASAASSVHRPISPRSRVRALPQLCLPAFTPRPCLLRRARRAQVGALECDGLLLAGQPDGVALQRLIEALALPDAPVELGPRLEPRQPHPLPDEAPLPCRPKPSGRPVLPDLLARRAHRERAVSLERLAEATGDVRVQLLEEVEEVRPVGRAVDGRVGVGVAKGPRPEPDLGDREAKERDAGDAPGRHLAVRAPHLVVELVRVQERLRLRCVEARLPRRPEERRPPRRRLAARALLEVPVGEGGHELLALAEARGPEQQPLALYRLPVDVGVEVELDAGRLAELRHVPLEVIAAGWRARIVREALVPNPLALETREAAPPVRIPAVLVCRLLTEEAERPSGYVERKRHCWVRVVKVTQRMLKVVLADVTVGSLGARDKISFHTKRVRPCH